MLKLVIINSKGTNMTTQFDKVFELMQNSFPENEYRGYDEQKKLLKNPLYKIWTQANENGDIIAFMAFWSFNDFIFVEHLAVSQLYRGKGLGTKMIQKITKNFSKPIILEIEVPCDEFSIKRLNFYERLGFKPNDYKYCQLPLRKNDAVIEMIIMSYPKELSNKEFEKIKSEIYKEVYGASKV